MEWMTKHADVVIILMAFGSLLWANGKFNEIEKDVAVIKAVMHLKNIMPPELEKKDE